MVCHLHDIAGGSVQTAPAIVDLENEEVGPLIHKYMGTKPSIDGQYRTRLFHATYDFTACPQGLWQAIFMLQSSDGLYVQRIVSSVRYDMARSKQLAVDIADLHDVAPV